MLDHVRGNSVHYIFQNVFVSMLHLPDKAKYKHRKKVQKFYCFLLRRMIYKQI